MAATDKDIDRAVNAEEAARALAWRDNRLAILTRRAEALDSLRGDPALAAQIFERYAALLPSPGDREPEPEL
jgi:hypothetical protein